MRAPAGNVPSYAGSSHGSGGGSLLAWTNLAASSSSARRGFFAYRGRRPDSSHRGGTKSALTALFIDDAMDRAADPVSAVASFAASSSSTADTSSWSSLQRDVASWLLASDGATSGSVESSSAILSASETSPDRPPTKDEIATLQRAFASFYGAERNVPEAYELLSKCIAAWEGSRQGGDEIAGLYRVRGDVNMELFQPKEAVADYAKAIEYLEGADGYKADPEELPASRLGRARAVRSMGSSATVAQAIQASKDYETYFILTSRLDEDADDAAALSKKDRDVASYSDAVVDGIQRNPYAAWEWGMVNRVAQKYDEAAEVHRLASVAFDEIGDKPRSVICALDRGLDLAAGLDESSDDVASGGGKGKGAVSKENGKKLAFAQKTLEDAISSTVNVEGRDVELLQRVVAKEGEARVALSGVLWNSNSKGAAEEQYGTACSRLDELNADYQAREADRIKKGRMPPIKPRGSTLGFSIDDLVGADEASCSRFKNEKFIEEKLVWNDGLRAKVNKFLNLSR